MRITFTGKCSLCKCDRVLHETKHEYNLRKSDPLALQQLKIQIPMQYLHG